MDSPHFVGREAELESVRALVSEAGLSKGGALIWLGEGGIGKSRFLRECAAMKLAALTANARCGRPPALGADVSVQLAAALRLPMRGRERGRAPAVLAGIAARAKRRPVAVFLDDLHLANARERSFADALILAAQHHPIAVVGCTAFLAPRDDAWERDGAAVRRLSPLDESSMELLVRGLAAARGVADDELREILRTAQGNPRYAVELVGAASDPQATTRVPASARAAAARLRELLSARDFEVLCACGAVGESFCGDWIAEVARRPRGDVADALQRGSDLGLIVELGERPGWLAFRDRAVRMALYGSLVALKQRILHERIVRLLSRRSSEDPASIHELLAYHAARVGDSERAAESYARAADLSFDAGAYAAAAALGVRAAAHLRPGEPPWIDRLQRAIRSYRYACDWLSVKATAQTLFEGLDRAREPSVASVELENLFLAQLNNGEREAAERTVEEIAALGTRESERRRQLVTLTLAYSVCYSGGQADASRLLATVRPKDFDDAELSLRYFMASAEIGAFVTPLDATLAQIERAAESARRLSIIGEVLCYAAGVEIACRYGDLKHSREYIGLAQRAAEKSVGPTSDSWRLVVKERSRMLLLSGDLRAARELVRANVGWLPSGLHNKAFDAYAAVTIGMRVGDFSLVDAFFDPRLLNETVASRDAESCGLLLFGFADTMLVRGMARDLRVAVERCVAEELIDPYTAIQLYAVRYASIESAVRAVEQTERYFAGAIAPSAEAHVALGKAVLLRRQGRHIAASDLAAKAAARFGKIGWRLYEAMALELAGDVRAASGRYGECGAMADVARLAAGETRKLKLAPFGARLSHREREVARLVAAKRSNRDIARALEISVRTVDHHVEAAFSKLGIRARWELTPEMLTRR